jgi:hypothetical protein
MKAVVFDVYDWERKVWPKIVADYGPAVNISWVCRERLGFTVRRHTDYSLGDIDAYTSNPTTIRLDFYDEASQTMFLLKYR